MPLVGAVVSLLFFEFVYKKTQQALDHDEGEKHTDDGILDN